MDIAFELGAEETMLDFSADLAACANPGSLIFLCGELGAGKTTFARGIMRGLGYLGAVKSPTYTLVECYSGGRLPVYHFDLYRLEEPEELEFIGFRDYLNDACLVLVEWPERAKEFLPEPDARIFIEPTFDGRKLLFSAKSKEGDILLGRAKTWFSNGVSSE